MTALGPAIPRTQPPARISQLLAVEPVAGEDPADILQGVLVDRSGFGQHRCDGR